MESEERAMIVKILSGNSVFSAMCRYGCSAKNKALNDGKSNAEANKVAYDAIMAKYSLNNDPYRVTERLAKRVMSFLELLPLQDHARQPSEPTASK